MSRSESDDDEFESADEGDESTEEKSSSGCSTDASNSDDRVVEVQPECISDQKKEEVIQDDIPPVKTEASSNKLLTFEAIQTDSINSMVDVKVECNDNSNKGILNEQKSTENPKNNEHETDECRLSESSFNNATHQTVVVREFSRWVFYKNFSFIKFIPFIPQ